MVEEKILTAKEDFWLREQDIVRKNNMTLISIKFNIPSYPKNSPTISQAFMNALNDFLQYIQKMSINYTIIEQNESTLGPFALILTKFNSKKVKTKTIEFENNHYIGRLFDIDIIDKTGKTLDRLKKRMCFLCNNPVIECLRLNRHTVNEVRTFFDQKINSYLYLKSIEQL